MLALGIATPATAAAAASSMALTATAATDDAAQGAQVHRRWIRDSRGTGVSRGSAGSGLGPAGSRSIICWAIGWPTVPAAIASLFATASTTALVLLRRYRAGSADKR